MSAPFRADQRCPQCDDAAGDLCAFHFPVRQCRVMVGPKRQCPNGALCGRQVCKEHEDFSDEAPLLAATVPVEVPA